MKHVDMRKLPAAAQEERRRQVIGLRERGLTYGAIAAQVGLSRTGVFDICKRFCGRGRQGAGEPAARAQAQRAAAARCGPGGSGAAADLPASAGNELGLPFALWNRAAVCEVIRQRCGVVLAIRTVGKYLARWGFTAQKPLRRAYEQNPAAVRCWLRRDYPAIVAATRRAHGTIFWGDEIGLRSDDVRGRGYAPRGRTPVVRVCRGRAGLSLISAVSNRGALRWMVLDGAVNVAGLDPLPPAPHPGRPAQGVLEFWNGCRCTWARPDPRLAGRAQDQDRGVLPARLQSGVEPRRGVER